MVAVFTVLSIIAVLLIVPGWLFFRRNQPQSWWLLSLPIFGICLWLALVTAGVGAQSLGNIIESVGVVAAAVVVAYLKFVVLDRSSALRSRGTFIAFIAVALFTLGLRLFMPLLPE